MEQDREGFERWWKDNATQNVDALIPQDYWYVDKDGVFSLWLQLRTTQQRVKELEKKVENQSAGLLTLVQRNNSLQSRLEKYDELLYAVGTKYPDESRHQTALRYIRKAESQHNVGSPKDSALAQNEGVK